MCRDNARRSEAALSELLADTGGLATTLTEVVQLGAADCTAAFDGDAADRLAVSLKDALNAFTVGDLAYREGGVDAAVTDGDDDAFEGLQTLALTFLDPDLDDYGIAGGEVGDVVTELFLFKLGDDVVHGPVPVPVVSVTAVSAGKRGMAADQSIVVCAILFLHKLLQELLLFVVQFHRPQ